MVFIEKRIVIIILGIIAGICMSGCGEEQNDSEISHQDSRLPEFTNRLSDVHSGILPVTQPILSDDGIIVQTAGLKEFELSTSSGRNAYRDKANNIAKIIADLQAPAARLLLKSYALEQIYYSFMKDQRNGFQPEDTQSSEKHPRFLTGALVATGIILSVYGTYSSINSAVDKTQVIVVDTASRSEVCRKGVVDILHDRGVDVPDSASAEEIRSAFEILGRTKRMSIANDVRNWVVVDLGSEGSADADSAVQILENDRTQYVEAANELGKVALEATIEGNMNVTGSVGSALEALGSPSAKFVGAATDLTLQITETDPISLVKKNATVLVSGTQTLVNTDSAPEIEMTREDAENTLKAIADNTLSESEMTSVLIESAGKNIVNWHFSDGGCNPDGSACQFMDGTHFTGGSLMTAAPRFMIAQTTIENAVNPTDEKPAFQASLPVKGFIDTYDGGHLLVTAEGMAPAETNFQVVNGKALAELHFVPLDGTITASAEPISAQINGTQKFQITAELIHVYNETAISLDATQTSLISSRKQLIASSGSVAWELDLMDKSQVVILRHDTGESYSMMLDFEKTSEKTDDNSALLSQFDGTYHSDVVWGDTISAICGGSFELTSNNGDFVLTFNRISYHEYESNIYIEDPAQLKLTGKIGECDAGLCELPLNPANASDKTVYEQMVRTFFRDSYSETDYMKKSSVSIFMKNDGIHLGFNGIILVK